MRPHLFLTADPVEGLRSVADVAQHLNDSRVRDLWAVVRGIADEAVAGPPLTPRDDVPDREASQLKHANRDFVICEAAGQRLLCAAFAHLMTGERKYVDAALSQLDCLFDESQWPAWCDLAHIDLGLTADLRTGMLGEATSITYDWLHASLDASQRRAVLDGIDRCAIQRYFGGMERKEWWVNATNNWMTVMIGGMGIAGMALGSDHPRSQELIDLAVPRMTAYLESYGKLGEFNENIAYAGASNRPVQFFDALRYETHGHDNLLSRWPFPEHCRWMASFLFPPGFVVPVGDAHPDRVPGISHFANVAAASRDAQVQWAYEQYRSNKFTAMTGRPLWELLSYDPTLRAESPQGVWPMGAAFPEHSGNIISRSTWSREHADCVVFSKAGHGAEGHGHHDAGEVLIWGHNKPLLIDPGVYPYPKAFFGKERYEFYFASSRGHNVPTFDGKEMKRTPQDKATIRSATFDDARGGAWQIDLTGMYEDVTEVTRHVIHLLPGVVAVLDEAALPHEQRMAIRWHTADRAEPSADGHFTVHNDGAACVSRIVRLDDGELSFLRGQHEMKPPYDRNRLGELLEGRNESYIEAAATGGSWRVLSLFAVFGGDDAPAAWQHDGDSWQIDTCDGRVQVAVDRNTFTVSCGDAEGWSLILR